jgi:hypothetical protein
VWGSTGSLKGTTAPVGRSSGDSLTTSKLSAEWLDCELRRGREKFSRVVLLLPVQDEVTVAGWLAGWLVVDANGESIESWRSREFVSKYRDCGDEMTEELGEKLFNQWYL